MLIATLRLRGEAYSVSVMKEIQARTGRQVSQAAVFIAMRRLQEKGLLGSSLDDQSEEKGHTRRYFVLTEAGTDKLREMRGALVSLWDGFTAELDGAQ